MTGFHGAGRAHTELMMCSGGTPASSRPRITAATTAGRVPLIDPAAEKTLIPTTSCVATRLRQASAEAVLPVRLVMPRFTIVCTRALSGWKLNVAFGSSTTTTRAWVLVEERSERKSAPRNGGPERQSAPATINQPNP
jgi:hypothetical protein